MAKSEDMVKIPRKMYEELERQASRTAILLKFEEAVTPLKGFQVIGVVTHPPSGERAKEVLSSVQVIVALARNENP